MWTSPDIETWRKESGFFLISLCSYCYVAIICQDVHTENIATHPSYIVISLVWTTFNTSILNVMYCLQIILRLYGFVIFSAHGSPMFRFILITFSWQAPGKFDEAIRVRQITEKSWCWSTIIYRETWLIDKSISLTLKKHHPVLIWQHAMSLPLMIILL